jgi:DNA-binding sugar fermentation-stimulating protein
VTLKLELDGVKLGTYRVDFIVDENDGTITYVEAKGIPFPLWKQKWAILQGMHKDDPLVKFQVVRK